MTNLLSLKNIATVSVVISYGIIFCIPDDKEKTMMFLITTALFLLVIIIISYTERKDAERKSKFKREIEEIIDEYERKK